MKYKAVSVDSLDDIEGRLIHCRSILDVIMMAIGDDPISDAIAGVGDMLDSITQDFQENITAAEDYPEGGPQDGSE